MSDAADREDGGDDQDEAPPLGRWSRIYLLVLGVLVTEIVLFSLFTKVFE